jgi:hypothetical protein
VPAMKTDVRTCCAEDVLPVSMIVLPRFEASRFHALRRTALAGPPLFRP